MVNLCSAGTLAPRVVAKRRVGPATWRALLLAWIACSVSGCSMAGTSWGTGGLLTRRPDIAGVLVYVDDVTHLCGPDDKWIRPSVYLTDGKTRPRLLVKEDIDARHEFRSSPAVSPDATMVAYIVALTDYAREVSRTYTELGGIERTYELVPEKVNRRVFVARIDGSDRKDLSRGFSDDLDPEWSPDGKQLAFSSGARRLVDPEMPFFSSSVPPVRHQIWVMDADGRNRRQVTDLPRQCFHPTWSPDGKQIAFAAEAAFEMPNYATGNLMMLDEAERPFYCDLWVINSDGTNPRQLTKMKKAEDGWGGWTGMMDHPSAWEPHWSPVGDSIIFVYNDQLYLADAKTGELRQLTRFDPGRHYDHPFTPCWSPDGEHVCFAFHRFTGHHLFSDHYESETDLYIIRKDGSGLKGITRSHSARQPSWAAGELGEKVLREAPPQPAK